MNNNNSRSIFIVIGVIFLLFIISSRIATNRARSENRLLDGDIIFQTSMSGQSQAIQLATHSKYSHMGIIFIKDGQPFVDEAIQQVQMTPLNTWIQRGQGGHYVVKRLKTVDLNPINVKKLIAEGNRLNGKPYDIYFEWSDDKVYCSELVWKIYKRALNIEIGKLQTLKEFDLTSDVVKSTLKERYGENVPLNESVISPVAMFNSDALVTVIEK